MLESEGFTDRQKHILGKLYRSVRWLSTKEVAIKSELSWETCSDELGELASSDYVKVKQKRDRQGKLRRFWKFNYTKHRALKSKRRTHRRHR